jgi:energy-coupling factor transporter ATP-binding protein EcfA2
MTTWDKVRAVLESAGLQPKLRGNQWRMKSPYRVDSDSDSFTGRIEADGEHGAFHDKVNDAGYSLYQLAGFLGVETPKLVDRPATTTKRKYKDFADYADQHGAPVEAFAKAGWSETLDDNRPALRFKTRNGDRLRYLDDGKPRYKSPFEYQACWYGLEKAAQMAAELGVSAIVLCNGEASTVVAQYYGIPAACVTGGERKIADALLAQFKTLWNGDVWLAYDCDETGKRVAQEVLAQFKALDLTAYTLDLGLQAGGDLADLCRLYGIDTYKHLSTLVPQTTNGIVTSTDVAKLAIANIGNVMHGEPLVFPFKVFHRLGGMCRVIAPGEVVIITGVSGGGKTSFIECMTEPLIQRGRRGLWDGKEWSPPKMHARRMQRLTGITTEQQKLYEYWKVERQRGVPDAEREGVALTPQEEQAYIHASQLVAQYVGRMEYMPQLPCLEDTLGLMSERLAYYRRRRETVSFVVFDYAQLWKMRSTSNAPSNLFEYALDAVKDWTLRENIVTFTLSQSNKDATDKVKVAGSTYLLGTADAQYIRDDKCNLMITLNPQYEEDRNHMHNGQPSLRKMNYVVANVCKNSDGKEGFIRLESWWERLSILDKIKPAVQVDLGDRS